MSSTRWASCKTMLTAVISIVGAVVAPCIGAVVSAFVGRHVARRVTESELKKSEARAQRAEALYAVAIDYLRQVAEWATRNGIADKLPDPPEELGIKI